MQCCASAAQQQPKHCCVISTVLVTNPKLRTVWAVVEQIICFPAKPSTGSQHVGKHVQLTCSLSPHDSSWCPQGLSWHVETHQPCSHHSPRAEVSVSSVLSLPVPNQCLGSLWKQKNSATTHLQTPASTLMLIPLQGQLHKDQGMDPAGYSIQSASVILKKAPGRKHLAEHPGTSPRGEVQQIALRLHHIF